MKETHKVYIAAPFFNVDQESRVNVVERVLFDCGIDYFSPRSFGVIQDMSEEEKKHTTEIIYKKNIEEIHRCNIMVAITDDKDTGTLFELGYAASLKEKAGHNIRHIITINFGEKPVNVMLRYCLSGHATNWNQLYYMIKDLLDKNYVSPKNTNFPDVNE